MTDNPRRYNKNNEKVWDTARMTRMFHGDKKWAIDVEKMMTIDLPDSGLPQTFHLFKKKSNEAQ